jgi:hypothetical protein
MPATKHKYRPAFSEEEVEALATILLEAYLIDIKKPSYLPDQPANSKRAFSPEMRLTHHRLIGKINTLRSKIANNALSPAYSISKAMDAKVETLKSLGAPADQIAQLDGTATKEDYWARCYDKYITADTYLSLTISELEAAQEHRYLNDLMTAEEMVAHERKDIDG